MAPPAPSIGNLAVADSVDVVGAVLTAVAAVLYVAGVRRLRARGRVWRPARSAAFGAGLVVIVVATQSGLARYDTVLFSTHVVQHVLLGMVAPMLLVLGAPITLALQASSRPTTAMLLRGLHHPVVRMVAHPVVATTAFVLTPFVLWFTPLYELSLRSSPVHAWVHIHMVVVGALFAAVVIGDDPLPSRPSHPLRLLLVAVLVPAHAVGALALLSGSEVLAGSWYAQIERAWGSSPLHDQRTGGGIFWVTGEVIGVVLALMVTVRWMRAADREARRLDTRSATVAGVST